MQLGVDLLFTVDIAAVVERQWFRDYVFSPPESEAAAELAGTRRLEFLAGRFSAKEAVLKVLQSGLFGPVVPRDIVIRRAASGRPEVRLAGTAAVRAASLNLGAVALSITHKRGVILTTAIAAPLETDEWSVAATESIFAGKGRKLEAGNGTL